eukprot:TRINITY_DN7868_c0_g1_i3.p1 TRINITY_DN7868_c0_g1~~TRINITY_DN7868_c0_g1_i3.p1  ORF type:complete len:251 (-),score=35.61 TRINITY_DN7868_c0_g1_i3:103-855(-)
MASSRPLVAWCLPVLVLALSSFLCNGSVGVVAIRSRKVSIESWQGRGDLTGSLTKTSGSAVSRRILGHDDDDDDDDDKKKKEKKKQKEEEKQKKKAADKQKKSGKSSSSTPSPSPPPPTKSSYDSPPTPTPSKSTTPSSPPAGNIKPPTAADQQVIANLNDAATLSQQAADLLKLSMYHKNLLDTVQALRNSVILIQQGQRSLVPTQIGNAISTLQGVAVMLDKTKDSTALGYMAQAKAKASAAQNAFKP